MKKRTAYILMALMAGSIITGCGKKEEPKKENTTAEEISIEETAKEETSQSEMTNESEATEAVTEAAEETETTKETEVTTKEIEVTTAEVDLDLTQLSSTMVFSEINNLMMTPSDYFGKTIRMKGQFVAYSNEDQSKFYPAVIIADATACCAQGLEFILKGDPAFPDAYPERDSYITVVGTFETYDEDGTKYCHLADAVIE